MEVVLNPTSAETETIASTLEVNSQEKDDRKKRMWVKPQIQYSKKSHQRRSKLRRRQPHSL
jgi:flagellar basal body-associated protein FliL